MITGRMYDVLKFMALIALPALGTFYVTVAALWDLPKPQEVAGTILAADTLLGTLLQISSNAYKKGSAVVGDFVVGQNPAGGTVHTLAIDSDKELEDLEKKTEVKFRVVKKPRKTASSRLHDESGITLIEMLVVLAIGLALVAILFAAGVFH